MPDEIEFLVIGAGKGTESRGDGVVAAWLDLDVVGRIGVDQVNGGAVQELVHVGSFGGIAAEQTIHRLWTFEVPLELGQCGELVRCFFKFKRVFEFALPIGILSGLRQDSAIDYLAGSSAIAFGERSGPGITSEAPIP